MSEPDRILLDTSVLLDYKQVSAQLPEQAEGAVSAVSIAELAAGLQTAKDPVRQAQRQLNFQWVTRVFEPIVFDVETAQIYGSLALLVTRIGRKPRGRIADLQIAASGVQHALPLYTRNPNDFKGLEPLLNVIAV